jgi:hypothetical protein
MTADAISDMLFAILREVALALDFWPYSVALLIVLAGMAGSIGRGVGLDHLFRDDDQLFNHGQSWRPVSTENDRFPPVFASPAFWSGFGFMATFGLFWIVMHAGGRADCGTNAMPVPCPSELYQGASILADPGRAPMLWALGLVFVIMLALNYVQLCRMRADFERMALSNRLYEMLRLAAGGIAGVALALLGYALPFLLAPPAQAPVVLSWLAQISYALPQALFVLYVLSARNALPCTSIFSLIMAMLVIGTAYPDGWALWTGLFVLLGIVALAILNGRPGKYSLPGFAPAQPGKVPNPQAGEGKKPRLTLIEPTEALQAWKGTGTDKPILVLVATSGGAYRAGFWTSLLLDHLIRGSGETGPWPGLSRNIRLFTGASGGMVGAAYFVAMAAEGRLEEGVTRRICEDTWRSLKEGEGRKWPIARDSLSPIVHQLVRRDLPRMFAPAPQPMDRGRKLDAQWRTLGTSFTEFYEQERAGTVPSIILAPMLVETGALALFSNLDLQRIRLRSVLPPRRPGDENKASVSVFRHFDGAHSSVSLATAVRLNATFPYVSPAISLPTWPERRPVDAGYYDNYGVDLLTAYLEDPKVFDWVTANCAGVAVIQVRAFPSEAPTAPASGLARAFQFVTSPPEGLFSARAASQMFRNDQQLVATTQHYAEATRRDFLRVFTFEANTDVSLSWYQRCDEMRALEGLLVPPSRDELRFEGPVVRPPPTGPDAARNRIATLDEVQDWALSEFGSWETLVSRLQEHDPKALRSQYLHHRAKLAKGFADLESFWTSARTDSA